MAALVRLATGTITPTHLVRVLWKGSLAQAMLVAPGISVEDKTIAGGLISCVLSSTLRPGATSMACAYEPFQNTRTRCVGVLFPVAHLTSAATNIGSEVIEKSSILEKSRKVGVNN